MASNRDILEAQRFNRKRLVTAFASGTPGGRELEPRSRMTPLIVGVVISALMLAVAAVMGRFAPTLPSGWENNAVIVVKGTGARYLTVDGVLRPVENMTSARLLSDPGAYAITEVGASTVSGIPRGSRVGIPGAPDDVPAAAALGSDQWTACAPAAAEEAAGPTRTWIGAAPPGWTAGTAALVTSEGRLYLLADGLRHPVSEGSRSGVALALGVEGVRAHPVSAAWLSLFEEGSELAPLEIDGAGLPAAGLPPALSTAVVGSVVEVEEGASQRRFVVIGDGAIAPLPDVAWDLYQIGRTATIAGNPLTVTVAEIADLDVVPAGPVPADWPPTLGAPLPDDATPCASLVLADSAAAVSLGSVGPAAEAVDEDAAPLEDAPEVTVDGGSGALIRASSGGTFGATMLITDDGLSHGLGADPSDTLARLGYADSDVRLVPGAWAALVPSGVDLSAQAAWDTVGIR